MTIEPVQLFEWSSRRFGARQVAYDLASSGMEQIHPNGFATGGFNEPVRQLDRAPLASWDVVAKCASRLHDVQSQHVLSTTSVRMANFLLQAALLRGGDRVLCEWPSYEPLWQVARSLGASVEFVERDSSRRFEISASDVAEGFRRGARALIISDVHNPSGTVLERELLRELDQVACRYDAWLFVDEAHVPANFLGPPTSSYHIGTRILATGGLGKAYGMACLRTGWILAPAEIIARARHIRACIIGGSAPCVGDELIESAFNALPELRRRAATRWHENLPFISALVEAHKMEWTPPSGGFFAWTRLPSSASADDFVDRLFRRYDTLVAPGSLFGKTDYVRIGFGSGAAVIAEGIRRVGCALSELQ